MARKPSRERPSPLALNYVERGGFRRRALCVLTLLALAEIRPANAACVPAGTSHGDAIVCSGSQTGAVTARSGDDSISILPNASIILGTQQSTAAVDAGSGNDSVVNDGLVSLTVAPPAVAPAGKSSSCSANRDVQGVGIAGGGGNDLVNNRGAIAVQTAASGTGAQCDPSHSDDKHDDDDGHRTVKPTAASIGILGGNGNDQISNSGSVAVRASSDAASPQVTAKGIAGANGDDVIVNTGTITVAASATQAAPSAQVSAPISPSSSRSHDSKPQDISDAGAVSAVGIEGGNGRDILRNDGTLTVNASATSSSNTRSLTLTGGDEVTATTTLETRAVGISGGAGRDAISNSGALTANATSEVNNTNVKLSLIDLAHSDTSTFVRSSATGIDAGSGSDSITIANTGTIAANATSKSSGVSVNLSLVAAATAASKTEVQATAVGIVGGQGDNTMDIGGAVKATATSQESDIGVAVNYADLTILDRQGNDVTTTVESKATGIDGSKGENRINIANGGSVEAVASSKLSSLSVSVGMEGVPQNTETLINTQSLVSGGITSNSAATGILGGGHGDYLTNAGSVTGNATSSAAQNTVNVGISLFEITIPTPNIGLAGAGTEANAAATGITSGSGDDTILNSGLVKSDASASATAGAFSISLGVISVNLTPGSIPLGATLIVADTATTASAQSTGIASGAGDDTIRNTGTLQTQAKTSAVSLAVSGQANIEYEKGDKLFTVDAVAARAGTEATSQAVGIDGGAGANQIYNDGSVTAGAASNATAVAVAVNVVGNLKGSGAILGLAATDTSGIATSEATGIRGGSDHDLISNTGSVAVTSNADVTSASASLNAAIAKQGLVAGVALARAESVATASATGIDGAGGRDEIENTGSIAATAKAHADAIGVSVAIEGTKQGVAGGAALTDTSTTATATAVGIRGGGAGEGDDRDHDDRDRHDKYGDINRISNASAISADAQAQTLSVSASVNVAIAKQGVALGGALARAESNAGAAGIGIDGGGGQGEIINTGTITAKATANADAIGVSLSVAGTKQGVAGSAALTDTSTTATATAIGIRSGVAAEDQDKDRHDEHDDKDKDRHDDKDGGRYDRHDDDKNGPITNTKSISVDAQANALSVSASANVSIAKGGVAIGAALADTSTHAGAVAKGIEASSANDAINNDGTLAVKAGSSGQAVSVALTVEGTAGGLAAGAALVDASVHTASTVIGVDGGAGDDSVTNRGAINIDKADSTATAVGVAVAALVAKEGAALGAALADTSATAAVSATGIDGGAGNDVLANLGTITAKNVSASADAVSVSLAVAVSKAGVGAGAALAKGDSTAAATATGLDGGTGDDDLLNQAQGSITLQGVKADADAVSVSLAVAGTQSGVALSAALVDAGATATATATGMAGGAGNDKLSNLGAIVASDIKADASAVGVSMSASFSQNGVAVAAALARTGTTANATAKGLDGGAGDDRLYNEGGVTLQQVKADAGAVSVSVDAAAAQNGLTIAAGLADASGKAFANATGADGGTGDDTLANSSKGKISVEDVGASAHAAGISVALSGSSVGLSAGAALADTSGTATSTAKGLDGGAGNDMLQNEGEIALKRTTADADSVSVSVAISASLTAGVAAGAALSRAGATASATATGMDGGAGNDQVLNLSHGSITLDGVTANANGTSVSVELGVTNAGVAIGAALADTRSTATSTAKGMDGGAGDDWLKNEGQITLQNVKADAGAATVSASLNGAITGGVAAGVALADGRSTAEVTAIGMDGGAGRDVLVNAGAINVQGAESNAHAVGVSVAANVSMAGLAGGAALADTSTTARTVAKGMDGGAGDDKIYNTGSIDVQGKSKADAVSVSVSISAALGVAVGAEVSKSNTTSETTVIGIDAGGGRDEIGNAGTINVKAEAESKAATVSVGLSLGAGGDATVAEAKASATATAVGINQIDDTPGSGTPDGTNVIENTGAVTAIATSKSTGTSISGNLRGFTAGDTTNTSTAEAIGIRMGDGKDRIRNQGAITATSDATATGLAVSVTLAGKAMGDASTTTQARATGIQAGGGDDEINNLAAINASARSSAKGTAVTAELAGVSDANTSTKALATATGIDGGSGTNTIVNRASVTASAGDAAAGADADCTTAGGACANSTTVSVTLAGTGAVDASTTAGSTATGIAGGANGDTIYSDGAIDASARAKTEASGVNVGIFGATQSSLDTTATASAAGVSGGDGDDVIEAHSTIKAASASHIVISGTGFSLGGSSGVNATLSATALATAIDGGAGNDRIHNEAALTVAATSTLSSSNGSTVVFGSSGAGAASGAFTDAAGMRAGAGDDEVWNAGAIDVRSTASLSLSSSSFTFGGTGGTDGSLTASTQATGISGGSGRDSITNQGDVKVSASSSLVSSGGSSVGFGTSGAGANSGAVTGAAGIDGGDDDDFIHNKGRVTASSSASLNMDNSSFSFGGTGGTNGSLTAATQATGIAGGKGRDGIMNEGELIAIASSSLVSSGGSSVAFGTSGAGANSGAVTTAVGIDGGDGDDVILNKGRITASSSASLSLSSSSFSFGGTGGTSGSLTASTLSTGIAGGKGRDSITNEGELNVSATSTQVSSGGSNVAFGSSGTGANSGAVTNAVGIDGGDDDDVIHNKGRINASSSASLSMDNSSFSFGGTGGTSGSLTASTQSAGIAGGKGRDSITNEGELNVSAGSSLVSTGGSSVGFGSSGAGSDSGAVTSAAGIDGGDGDDVILNKGRVTASADAALRMDSSSFSFAGGSGVSGTLTATTRSVGLRGGDGNDAIQNDGDVVVRASSDLQNSGSVSTSLGGSADASGEAASTLAARGIDGGAGDNWIANNGTIDVKAAVKTVSTLSSSSGFFAGQSTTIGNSRADMTAIGIDVGHGNNTVLNAGSIAVELSGTVSTTANSDGSSLGADATSISRSALAATAVGIAAGNGANQITNTGSIDVKTWRPVDLLDITLEVPLQASAGGHGEGHLGGDATVFISAQTSVFAAGISAGNGANTIRNEGSIAVDLRALANAVGSTDPGSTGGDGESHADTTIVARAVGIAAGDGANQITNTGSIRVETSLETRSDTFAIGHTTGDADALSTARTNVFAAGIDVGNGANMIRNEGTINVALSAAAATSTHTSAGTTGSNFDFSDARVNAQGYGIHAGSGNNTIVNKGTINVTVTGTASTNFGSGTSVTASATGIATGAGNDVITNEGTITATTIVNGVTTPGKAISAGAGDDVVRLTNGSVTNGTIDLGTGNNRLVLEGTPVINGTILDGSSSLGLVFNAAGSFAGALPGVSAVKNGPGTFTLSMLNKMQRIEVNQGTLKLDSDYTFMGKGMFQAKVGGDGTYGQFYVNGRAELDGTMKVVRGGGAYVNGTSYDVLMASNGIQPGTAFSRVELPADTRLLKFHTEQLPDSVVVTADVASFTTVAGTPNQMAVARNLDRILPRTSGQLNQLLGSIQALPDAQFASAFASMSPAVYAGYSASTFNSMQQYTNVLQDRMAALRSSDFSPEQTADALSGGPIRLAYAGKGLSDLLEARETERALSSGLWLRGFSQKGDQGATEGMNGYDYRLTGTTVGYDRRLTNSLSAGASFGTVKNKTNVDSNVSHGDVDTTTGSIYAGWFDRRLYVNAALSAGRNKYDTRRTNALDQSTISSSHKGDLLAATLGAGHYVQLGTLWLEPFATAQYTRLKEKAFSETGNGALALPARTSDGLVSTLGARFSRPIQDGNGASWMPQASLAWLHDYSKNQVINASYVDAPDSSFSIDGQSIQRNGALAGLGLSYRTKSGITSTLQYNGEFRDKFHAHGLAGEFRFEF